MTNSNHLPVEEDLIAAAKSIHPSDDFSRELWQRMAVERLSEKTSRFSFKRTFRIAAFSLATLAIIIFAIGPQQVFAAINQLVGYIPGIGFFTNDSQTLYLPEPVTEQQGKAALTVKQAVDDQKLLVISYEITGLKNYQPSDSWACMYDSNEVLLPDGKKVHVTGGGTSGEGDSLQSRVEFPALPEGVDHIKLLVSMPFPDPNCTAPTEWSIDLPLGPIPANSVVAEVNELPTSDTSLESAGIKPSDAPVISEQTSGIQFAIDRTVSLEDGYVISGHPIWESKEWEGVWLDYGNLQITDAKGKKLTFEPAEGGEDGHSFSFKVIGIEIQLPLHITIPSVLVMATPEEPPSFTFDAGTEPKIGQTWNVNQKLEIMGQSVQIQTIEAVKEVPTPERSTTNNGYAMTLKYDASVEWINIWMKNPGEYINGYGESKPTGENSEKQEFYYSKGLPSGKLTYEIRQIQFRIEGPWLLDIDIQP